VYVRSSPVYTLTNIIIAKLAGIQLRAVQSKGGAERGVEQKPLVNSGNIAEGRKIVSASGRQRSLPALRGRRDVATSGSCGRRQQEGKRGVPRTVNISPIGDERTDGQTSLQTVPRLVCVWSLMCHKQDALNAGITDSSFTGLQTTVFVVLRLMLQLVKFHYNY